MLGVSFFPLQMREKAPEIRVRPRLGREQPPVPRHGRAGWEGTGSRQRGPARASVASRTCHLPRPQLRWVSRALQHAPSSEWGNGRAAEGGVEPLWAAHLGTRGHTAGWLRSRAAMASLGATLSLPDSPGMRLRESPRQTGGTRRLCRDEEEDPTPGRLLSSSSSRAPSEGSGRGAAQGPGRHSWGRAVTGWAIESESN